MRIEWDKLGERLYKVGLDRGVLYQFSGGEFINGVAWNGLTEVSPEFTGREETQLYTLDTYRDDTFSNEVFSGTIKAYTYPDEFLPCMGIAELLPGVYLGEQTYASFGLSYRTGIGNDAEGETYGYEIHLLYNAKLISKTFNNKVVGANLDPELFNFKFKATPVDYEGYDPFAELTINSLKVGEENLAKLEAVLYGDDENEARLPLPEEIYEIITHVDPGPTPPEPEEHPYPDDDKYPDNDRYPNGGES